MIEVCYERDIHRLTVKGHANSAERGKDLVCCAASMLLLTLNRAVEELTEKNFTASAINKVEKGDAEIWCVGEYNRCYTLIFDTIALGFEMLAEEYPKNISYSGIEKVANNRVR